jgi:uncharacterized delta-60 repeat protein
MILLKWWKRASKLRAERSVQRRRPGPGLRQPRYRLILEQLEDRTVLNAGAFDPSFGTGGQVLFNFTNNSGNSLHGIAFQADGKIVAAGSTNDHTQAQDFALARFNTDGSVDSGFGNGGRVTTDFGANRADAATAVVIQADGKIIAGGFTLNNQGAPEFALARYNADGSLDSTFGTGGLVITIFSGGGANLNALALQPDGEIVAVGTNGRFVAARYNPDGGLDSTFGSGGIATTPNLIPGAIANAVVLQPDGKITLGGQTAGGNHALARFNADGTQDTTFGNAGIVITTFGFFRGEDIRGLALQPDGAIVATGVVNAPNATMDIGLIRYNPDGSLDTTFGNGGMVHTDLGNSDDAGNAVALQADGHIIVVGGRGIPGGTDSVIVRYNSDGSLDTTFGNNGFVVTNYAPGGNDQYFAVALQADGQVVAGGSVNNGPPFILARYLVGDAPHANAGGPYTVPEGGMVQLDATGSTPGTAGDTLTYEWDFDNDGIFGQTGADAPFGDEVGSNPTFLVGGLDGPGSVIVTLRVTESNGFSSVATAIINITNVPPTAAVTGPSLAVPGQPLTFTLTATDPSLADQAAGFTYAIDWKGNGTDVQTVTGLSGIQVQHTFTVAASYTIRVTATDKDGGTSNPATHPIAVPTATLETDPGNSSQTALYVGAPLGNSTIDFRRASGGPGRVQVVVNGVSLGIFTPTGHLIAYGQAGNDTIRVASDITLPAVLFGGQGNDVLQGGGGTNIIVGGMGTNSLIGGTGRNVLIAGLGSGTLRGGSNDDILIGGRTAFDANIQALLAIMAEWSRTDANYVTRISHLSGTNPGGRNGAFLLTQATVFDNGVRNTMTGNGGLNWFFAHLGSGPNDDRITDLGSQELVTVI